MKIFHIITSLNLGGAERIAINIAKSSNKKFEYHIVEVVRSHGYFTDSLLNEIKQEKIKIHRSPISSKKLAIIFFPLWFIIIYIKNNPSVIHSHTEVPDLALWIFRKISWAIFWIKPKYVRTIHNTELWNDWKVIGKIVEKYYLRHHCNVAISTSTQENYIKEYGGTTPPIIYNGLREVPQKKFQHLKPNLINILFAGRLEHQKGIDELINVVTALEKDKRFFFHIVGDGSMKEKLYSSIQNLTNVATYHKIYGLSQYLNSFDYLFVPSNHEGLALMPIEASLAHTPSIINSCPGLKDTLPQDWELSVKNNSIKEFIRLFTNIESYSYTYLSEKAYKFAASHFSIKKMQFEYEKIYEQQF